MGPPSPRTAGQDAHQRVCVWRALRGRRAQAIEAARGYAVTDEEFENMFSSSPVASGLDGRQDYLASAAAGVRRCLCVAPLRAAPCSWWKPQCLTISCVGARRHAPSRRACRGWRRPHRVRAAARTGARSRSTGTASTTSAASSRAAAASSAPWSASARPPARAVPARRAAGGGGRRGGQRAGSHGRRPGQPPHAQPPGVPGAAAVAAGAGRRAGGGQAQQRAAAERPAPRQVRRALATTGGGGARARDP